MPIFDPSGPALLDIDSGAGSVSAVVQVTPDPAVVPAEVIESVRVEHNLPAPFAVVTDQEASNVSVTAPSIGALFPAESIRYLAGTTIGEVTSFGALPEDTDNILSFRPSSQLELTFTLTVFASVVGVVGETSASYTIVVEANRDAGKAALLAAIAEFG